jgi:hypothetical protein
VVSYSPLHAVPSREQALHALYEAAELEHCLMCTYLYAAFSLKTSVEEGVTGEQLAAITRWKQSILQVAIEEMGHLMSVWNSTARGTSQFSARPGISAGRRGGETGAVQPVDAAAFHLSGASGRLGRTRW